MEALQDYAGAIIVIAGAVSAVGVVAVKGWPVLKSAARAIVLLETIAKEFTPNGGASLVDKVNEIRAVQTAHGLHLVIANERLEQLEHTLNIVPERVADALEE